MRNSYFGALEFLVFSIYNLRPFDILTGEIPVEVTGVVGVSAALWYFRYIASIFLILHKRLWSKATYFRLSVVLGFYHHS
jgi:hypothetical protein